MMVCAWRERRKLQNNIRILATGWEVKKPGTYTPPYEDAWKSGSIIPLILNLGARCI
jgi:hypothetical protein